MRRAVDQGQNPRKQQYQWFGKRRSSQRHSDPGESLTALCVPINSSVSPSLLTFHLCPLAVLVLINKQPDTLTPHSVLFLLEVKPTSDPHTHSSSNLPSTPPFLFCGDLRFTHNSVTIPQSSYLLILSFSQSLASTLPLFSPLQCYHHICDFSSRRSKSSGLTVPTCLDLQQLFTPIPASLSHKDSQNMATT